MFSNLFQNMSMDDLLLATYETFYMTIIALIGTLIFGVLLGLLLYLTTKDGIWQNKWIYLITAGIVNVFRAIPFIILILLFFPFTDMIVGTISGPNAALPSLLIGSASFSRLVVEITLKAVYKGVIES